MQSALDEFRDVGQVVAGEVVSYLLRRHGDYLDEPLQREDVSGGALTRVGPLRPAEEHLRVVAECWDPDRTPVLSGRHVVLGLALYAEVGWALLTSGVIGSLLGRWRPGLGTPEEPHRLVWDVLSDAGRERAEEQPLLATAFGAPPEWSVPIAGRVRAMAWAPAGDRLAVLAGDLVYEVRPGHPPQAVGTIGDTPASLGWGTGGIVALTIEDGLATLVRAVDGKPLGDLSGVSAGLLSGDGSHAWLTTAEGVQRWAPGVGTSTSLASARLARVATPLALDGTGHYGLLRYGENSVLVAALAPGPLGRDRVPGQPDWPTDAAPMIGWTDLRNPPCALATVGSPVVVYAESDGLHVDYLPHPSVCRIAVGPGEVTAMATDASGTRLAAAIGPDIAVWSIASRKSSRAVPGYDSDLVSGTDLLDADRDAQAIAALAASKELIPPLAIGLFGAWGSGKSFVLDRIKRILAETAKPPGYLRQIRVIEFNAWHYAEANLWASLVDKVLETIAPVASPTSPPEVIEATERAQEAKRAAHEAAKRVEVENTALNKAKATLEQRRKRAYWLAAAVLALLGAAVVAVVVGGPARFVAGVSAALALLGSAAGVLERTKRAGEQATDLALAGQAGLSTVGRLLGREEALAVQARGAELRRLDAERVTAEEKADRLDTELRRITTVAANQPLGTLLHRLSTITDYRDQLSLVTRTREHFQKVDVAIRESRRATADGVLSEDEAMLERIVVVIDDLDRCPPEKVVSVLEAVHLLFSFEMFVVLLAVDTRWLEQSLRMKYRQLLGRSGTAAPRDYLEKIIQVPIHLLPLDETMVRTMITGLTGAAPDPTQTSELPSDEHAARSNGTGSQASSGDGPLKATVPRAERGPLAAEVLRISPAEATAMATVAPLVGTTPRTVKRFVNTYRLLKARAPDVERFDEERDGLGDHEIVALLLALVTGQSAAAARVLPALGNAPTGATVLARVNSIASPDIDVATDGKQATTGPRAGGTELPASIATVTFWLGEHPRYGQASARRVGQWAGEVGRFSFTPP